MLAQAIGRIRRISLLYVVVLIGLIAVLATDDSSLDADAANAGARAPLPNESLTPGREGAEEAARGLAVDLGALRQSADAGAATCAEERVRVSWSEPADGYENGAHLLPLGPPPRPGDTAANGIVYCDGWFFTYMGFEALWDGERWRAIDVPDLGEEDAGPTPLAFEGAPLEDLEAGLGDIGPESPWFGRWGPEIEPLAAYDPQRLCDPAPKPAVAAFRALVQASYGFSRNLGISRVCDADGRSEHKEGRAWDWGVNVSVPLERQAANDVISWLLATDEHGNEFAMARRLGVMYIIWDRHVWSAERAEEGWRPYVGRSPHVDHVHLSFSRNGALGRTSFWSLPGLDSLLGHAGLFSGLPLAVPDGFFLGSFAPVELGPDYGSIPERVTTAPTRPARPTRPAPGGDEEDTTPTTEPPATVPPATVPPTTLPPTTVPP
ncbi:MAG TPA: hypothetical protein VD926_00590, partial [Acidimicrobiales bacterium]|nr:hypothetical protein [Acidimicrobiales bacterium]